MPTLLSQAKPGDRHVHASKHRVVLSVPPLEELFDFSINHLCRMGQFESPKAIDCLTSEKIQSWRQTRDLALFKAGSCFFSSLCLREGFESVFTEVNKAIQQEEEMRKYTHTHTQNVMLS